MSSRRTPPRFRAGILTHEDAANLNRAMEDLYRLVGGFTAAPPLVCAEDASGVRYGVGTLTAGSSAGCGSSGVTSSFSQTVVTGIAFNTSTCVLSVSSCTLGIDVSSGCVTSIGCS